jgi:uncharacterized protein (DUF4415 family)
MKKQPRPKQEADDNPEWTGEDFRRAVPLSALPEAEQAVLLSVRRRGRQKAPRKVPVSIRLSADVAEGLRATGEGWQIRVDEALRSWLAAARLS